MQVRALPFPSLDLNAKWIMEGVLAALTGSVIALIAATGVEFDWTISLGSLIAGFTVVIGIAGAAWRKSLSDSKIVDRVESVVKEMSAVKVETAERFSKVESKLDIITIMQVEQKNDRERLQNIERDNRELERRLLELERDSRRRNGNA